MLTTPFPFAPLAAFLSVPSPWRPSHSAAIYATPATSALYFPFPCTPAMLSTFPWPLFPIPPVWPARSISVASVTLTTTVTTTSIVVILTRKSGTSFLDDES